ncbi:MAG: hypothetical protein ACLTBV_20845 [Enterocloster bolteae]
MVARDMMVVVTIQRGIILIRPVFGSQKGAGASGEAYRARIRETPASRAAVRQ